MALARIISRSPQCSRELALDLLGRGYAVEIVSPDALPDNFADLELRVEADASNDLTASIAVHDGEHSTSLDFVHHLKAPLGEFVRRSPETAAPVYFPSNPVNFNAEPSLFEGVEPPLKDAALALAPTKQAVAIAPAPPKAVELIIPPEPVPLPAVTAQPEEQARTGITIIIHRSRSKPRLRLEGRISRTSGAWMLSAVAVFTIVVVLAVVLGKGFRRDTNAALAQNSPVEFTKSILPEGANVLAIAEAQHPALNETAGSQPAPDVSSQKPAPSNLQTPPSNSSVDALLNTDDLRIQKAIVLGDKPLAKRGRYSARHHKSRGGHHDGLVAADTVTYLDRPRNSLR